MAKTKYVAPKVMIQYGRVIASVLYRSCVPCNQQTHHQHGFLFSFRYLFVDLKTWEFLVCYR